MAINSGQNLFLTVKKYQLLKVKEFLLSILGYFVCCSVNNKNFKRKHVNIFAVFEAFDVKLVKDGIKQTSHDFPGYPKTLALIKLLPNDFYNLQTLYEI